MKCGKVSHIVRRSRVFRSGSAHVERTDEVAFLCSDCFEREFGG
jgi:hypothetical protein